MNEVGAMYLARDAWDAFLSGISVATEIRGEKEDSSFRNAQTRLMRCRRRATNRYARRMIGIVPAILESNQIGQAHQIRRAMYTNASAPPRIWPARVRSFISSGISPADV